MKKKRLCLFGILLLPILKLDNENAHAENVLDEAQQVFIIPFYRRFIHMIILE